MPSRSVKDRARAAALPLGRGLARAGVSADGVTITGFLFALAVAVALAGGHRIRAVAFLLASALCDLLDGAVARARGGGSSFGAVLDSAVDRAGEAVILSAILVAGLREGGRERFVWIWSVSLTASFLVSYVRARAEGQGLRCEVGLLERPERLGLLAIIILAGARWTEWGLGLLAILSLLTVMQRLLHVRRAARERGSEIRP
jgi:CDP-diacylglycerol---glycerol-3-phosphate 3-phosphatidyltransferase